MKFLKSLPLLFLVLICSCDNDQNKASDTLVKVIKDYQDHEGYDEDEFPLGLFTKDYYESEAEFANSKLEALSKIDSEKLNETDKISLALLKFVLQDKIDFYEFEAYLNPILSDAGFHSNLTYEVRPLTNYKQVKEYLNKLNAIPEFVDQHFVILREGLDRGKSQPLVIFKGYESTYNDHIVEHYEDSYYYSPFKSLPGDLNKTQKDSVLVAAREAVENNVLPQFERIKEFFETEYLPKTRTTIGVSESPNGDSWYQNRINYYSTNTTYTADDIHALGLKEVARIKAEMESIIKDLNFEGSFADFLQFLRTDPQFYATSAQEILMIARDMSKRADAQLPKFFKTLPRKPYGVAPVPDAIAPKYTAGRYIGTERNSTDPGFTG